MRALLAVIVAGAIALPIQPLAHQVSRGRQEPPTRVLGMAGKASLDITVVSYNIHGLPSWVAFDNPRSRIARIGALLDQYPYDVAFIQEDFAYHELLVEHGERLTAVQGNAVRSQILRLFPFLCGTCGSGLTTLMASSFGRPVEIQREPFGVCEGWMWHAADCWATKGFTRVRFVFAKGMELDLYNVHLDAGTSVPDQEARAMQMVQLRDTVLAQTGGRAMILAGDFNLDRKNTADREELQNFVSRLRLKESGASGRKGHWPRLLDYILFKSGKGVRLKLLQAGEAREFVREGIPLSDHPAISAPSASP